MNEEIKKEILETIKKYDRVIITRHKRPDGDAVGAALGLGGILRLSFPEKTVLLSDCDISDAVAFLGDPGTLVDDADFEGALAISLDTATYDRLADDRLDRAETLIRIDHHASEMPYGDLSWVEAGRSSCCEMIVDFWLTFRDELQIDQAAAACLYTGMVTDSGRFRFSGTTSDTLRRAAALLDLGVDTDAIFSRLYIDEPRMLTYEAYVLRHIRYTQNGVAWLCVSQRARRRLGLSDEEVGNCVNFMDSIKGSIIWLAILENGDGTWRVRLRSRFVEVRELATHFRGGGHANASGATLLCRSEKKYLLAEADELIREYKESHEDWI